MIQPFTQPYWPPTWTANSPGNPWAAAPAWNPPMPLWPQPLQQGWQVSTPSIQQPATPQPSPAVLQTEAPTKTDKTPFLIGGGILGAACLATYAAVHTRKSKQTEAVPPKSAPLKLKDFKLNPGVDLSTVAKRHAMTQKIVDAVFPQFYEMYQKDFKNCEGEANTLFNTVLRRELCKDACLKVILGTTKEPTGKQDAEFKPAYIEQVLPGVNLTGKDAQTPCFDLGKLKLHPTPSGQRSYDKEAFYNLMLHETNHLMYFLANNPSEFIKHFHTAVRDIVNYKGALSQFAHTVHSTQDLENREFVYGESTPLHTKLWQQFNQLAQVNQSPYKQALASAWGKEILKAPKEQLLQEYKYYIKNELESFTTYCSRFHKANTKVNPEDLLDGTRALRLRELCRFYEETLHLPPSEHTNLPITVEGVSFQD